MIKRSSTVQEAPVAVSKRKKRRGASLPASTLICLQLVDSTKLKSLQKLVGRRFKTPAYLAQALVHRSCHVEIENRTIIQSNEKLEHFGDKVVGLAVCKYLHDTYPQQDEHFFSGILNHCVSNRQLGQYADEAGLRPYIVVNRGSNVTKDLAGWGNVMADTFEAVAGALYLDGGSPAVDTFFSIALYPKIDALVEERLRPPPSAPPPINIPVKKRAHLLYQKMMEAGRGAPRTESMPDGSGGFVSRIKDQENVIVGEGVGPTKTQARILASIAALNHFGVTIKT